MGGLAFARLSLLICGALLSVPIGRATELVASDAQWREHFGNSVSLSGGTAIAAAIFDNDYSGSVYLFRNLESAPTPATEHAKLRASDSSSADYFGESVSLSGHMCIVGASVKKSSTGAAYLFRGLDTASGLTAEAAKLMASDAAAEERFGLSVSIAGNRGLVGCPGDDSFAGAVYLYRNLDTASGTVTQNVKLTASDRVQGDGTGVSVSLSGDSGLSGAPGCNSFKGAAYLFRNLNAASGTATENAKLTASNGAENDRFGDSVSLSGNSALVGAMYHDSSRGSAYLFRNLDTASGAITEAARLVVSDSTPAFFGSSVSLSGDTGIVGAHSEFSLGSAYLYRNLNTASGTVTQNVKLIPSRIQFQAYFGASVAIDGDRFVIGEPLYDGVGTDTGNAHTGRVSTFTIVEAGGSARATDGLSFISQDDWVIGQTTDGNQVVLTSGDSGIVTTTGKGVFIGRSAGADQNSLTVAGSLTANFVQVGAAGTTGNALRISGAIIASEGVTAASGSITGGDGTIRGNITFSPGAFLEFSPASTLTVTGSVSFPPTFGVSSLPGLTSSTSAGTYSLIDGTATNFASMGLTNWGQNNAHPLGEGKSAWFIQQGSGLQLVIASVPKTSELPILNISRIGGYLTLTWTTTLSDLVPESSTTLTGTWQTINTAPLRIGDTYTITLPLFERRNFYRLRKP